MIRLDDVTVTFPDGGSRLTALDRVSLTADRGSVTAITGPSGSGKSTLLAAAATLVRPDTGRVLLDDEDVSALRPAAAAAVRRRRIGIVFQQANLLASLTALEQLLVMDRLGDRMTRSRREATGRRAMELLDRVGLADQAGRRPHQLSGGQRQRVNIARALVHEPAVLLVDEPTSALDQDRAAAIIDLIVGLTAERDTATLLVTHDLRQLSAMDAVIRLVDGRVVEQSAPARAGFASAGVQ